MPQEKNLAKPSIKEVVKIYNDSGIYGVIEYYNNVSVYENTWHEKIKKFIDNNQMMNVTYEIETLLIKFNNYDKEKESNKETSGE